MSGIFGIFEGKRQGGCLMGRKKVWAKIGKAGNGNRTGNGSKRKYTAYGAALFLLAAATYLECCAAAAYVWAGFNGYGGIWMEYNEKGKAVGDVLFILPCFLLVAVMTGRILMHVKRKAPAKSYLCDGLCLAAGIAMGILSFYAVPEPRRTMIYALECLIRDLGWLEYPAG